MAGPRIVRCVRPVWLFIFALAFAMVRAESDEVWRLDNLKTMGGHEVSVVGSPRMGRMEGQMAIEFDGAHDGLFVTAIPIAGVKEFTIEVLFLPSEGGPEAQRFFHLQDTDGRRALLEIRTNQKGEWWLDGYLRTDLRPEDKGLTLIDPKRVHPTAHWYWVALRYDGKRLANYVNGQKESEGEASFSPFGDGRVSIGVRQNLVYWFKGAVSEVRFHREAIAEDKLQRAR